MTKTLTTPTSPSTGLKFAPRLRGIPPLMLRPATRQPHSRLSSMPQMTAQTQAVLAVLLRIPSGRAYGLEIARAASISSGTLYPILARLEKAGWVESEWEKIDAVAEGRPPRRYYRLTGEGERIAEETVRQTLALFAPFAIPRVSGAGA